MKRVTDLKRKINYFLSSSKLGRGEVKVLLDQLQVIGRVAIFGGMLRDLLLVGNEGFNSDIDLVIDAKNDQELDELLQSYNAIRNKFGGYRLTLSKWKVDVWSLQSTWAFKNGYVTGSSIPDLCKTTFFDWDGIVYDVGSEAIYTVDGYFDRLDSEILDINLEENPNPMGNIVKALRYKEKYSASFSNRLARYVYENLEAVDPELISKYESRSHQWPVLNRNMISQILHALDIHQDEQPLLPFAGVELQPSLWAAKSDQDLQSQQKEKCEKH